MPDAILIDTNVLLWWRVDGRGRLGPSAVELLESGDVPLFVSAISPWEMQIKNMKFGKPLIAEDFLQRLSAAGLTQLPITARDGIVAGALPLHHKDPFDRMLVAQCMNHDLMLMSADRDMHRYDIEVFPAGL